MCQFVKTINSNVKFRDTRLLITNLILPLPVSCCLARPCGRSLLTANVTELSHNLFSFVQSVNCPPHSKEGVSQWRSTSLKEWNFLNFHTAAYYQKDDRVFSHSEITELPVSGRRYVSHHCFSNTEKEFDFYKITLGS